MKKIQIIILLSLMCSFILADSFTKQDYCMDDYKIYQAGNSKPVNIQKMAKKLAKYDVIFFGEWHDDVLLHELEAELLPLLSKNNEMAVSLEMFERDVQDILNKYLEDEISEASFLENSRPWPNYKSDYRPLVEYAKENKQDVLAANVPRRYAALINKQGVEALYTIPEEEKQFVAKELKTLDNQYKKQFMNTMMENMGHRNAMNMKGMLDNIYAAQCLKDDTMAESIHEYLQKNPKKQVIHYNGSFHSESHLGTANKLKLLNPKLKIAVISPIAFKTDEVLDYDDQYKSYGDYLIFHHRVVASEITEVKPKDKVMKLTNSIISHKINLELNPELKSINGYDKILLEREISRNDTIFLFSALEVKSVTSRGEAVNFQIVEVEDYNGIIFPDALNLKELKINYGGSIYFPLKGRELNQTHDGTKGIISASLDEGIYLPGANWYPFAETGLSDFDITIQCPTEFKLLTSGKESATSRNGKTIYNWKSELATDHLTLVGNRFEVSKRVVDGVELRTYLLPEDAKFANTYLDGMEKYLTEYSPLFGEYPFSSFSVVENFFASGFGMPNYTLLAKEIVKMPFVTLSPGVIAHEFCHSWWGNSVYVDYEKGNWCEALTVFSSNYYQNILNENLDKAADWRKKAILENNLLPTEKNFPLKDFVYQHNDDDAVIGYQKGGMLFVSLHRQLGEEKFFEVIRSFYKNNKGRVAAWSDLQEEFNKVGDFKDFFKFWLNETKLASIKLKNPVYENEEISFSIIKDVKLPLLVPVKITLKSGEIIEHTLDCVEDETRLGMHLYSEPAKIEIDPAGFILKKISSQSMPYSLSRTLNDKPLVILPEKGELQQRLQMTTSMLSRSGYEVEIKTSNEVTDEDLRTKSLFILGEYTNNSAYAKLNYPEGFKIEPGKLTINGKEMTGSKASTILSFGSLTAVEKSISIYAWNSTSAIESFRKMFHYMNDSWQTFDLDVKEKGAIESGQIFPEGVNDLVHEF